jgi:glyoxalase family protein
VRPGTWHFAEGTPHHWAWNVVNEENQMELKGLLEGIGFTDVTEQKDRGYFLSVYNRTPGGALFEYAFTPPDRSFLIDETEEELGTTIQIPPPFAHLADEMIAYLEPIEDRG